MTLQCQELVPVLLMGRSISVGPVTAKAGEIRWGPATSVEVRDGTQLSLPVIVVNGGKNGPRVVLCGATHPTELSGTATIHALTKKLTLPN
jgi:predicted deacylase